MNGEDEVVYLQDGPQSPQIQKSATVSLPNGEWNLSMGMNFNLSQYVTCPVFRSKRRKKNLI